MELIFEQSVKGRKGVSFPVDNTSEAAPLPKELLREEKAELPELSELDVVRHFTKLSRLNFSVDTNFYPLGSCTMKYNAKGFEEAAKLFAPFHPMLSMLPEGEKLSQGSLELIFETEKLLAEITGMDAVTLQPMAGAHGEMTGCMLIAAYHKAKENKKKYVIVPDSSHGTNPASAAMVGYEIITIPTAAYGDMDLDAFKATLNNEVAAIMMTCPNTLGLFNPYVKEICDLAHSVDALVYYDGANLNAIMGKVRPGDIGFDVIHLNLHKTFGTPHGSGGPGSGPVGVKESLVKFFPSPRVKKNGDSSFSIAKEDKSSIGSVSNFFGNFGVIVKAYAYILQLGREGLIEASEQAVLNANYIMSRLKEYYDLPYNQICMHECVFSASRQMESGIHAIDIAKYLIDRKIHPPTVYFPLIVKEAIMIEPTETESKETMDNFIEIMIEAAKLAESDPDILRQAPLKTPVSRLDETKAAREQNVCCVL
ncbi:MAG: aminomethyl-transferring glycine dehydrogenase subunit GcvPB [Desulfuromonadales bacterium]|nr:aminomethyl-transferring glycine dehydrogenase subunit GcvPB [Desulfuromonadales bacterium]